MAGSLAAIRYFLLLFEAFFFDLILFYGRWGVDSLLISYNGSVFSKSSFPFLVDPLLIVFYKRLVDSNDGSFNEISVFF